MRRSTIPVPPLDEQERIVAILDKFDALVNDLSIGLPAEIAARRQQYEYYRDRLLTFEEGGMTDFEELGAPGTAPHYEPIAVGDESTVVAEFVPDPSKETAYQSEAELEAAFIELLRARPTSTCRSPATAELEANLRAQLEALNEIEFTDAEWQRFFTEKIAGENDGIVEKTARIQEDHVQVLERDDGTTKNINLIDKAQHPQQPAAGHQPVRGRRRRRRARNRYDVTILVNGLPLVHVELKRRGVDIREAFNQINRYQRDSFWSDSGLFEYVQLFVISNGTHTKYYSNTTRDRTSQEADGRQARQEADVEHASSSRAGGPTRATRRSPT